MKQTIPNFHLPTHKHNGIVLHDSEEFFADPGHDVYAPHRDEHYLMILMISGEFKALVDFNTFELSGNGIALILPGQVHQAVESTYGKAISISFDPVLVASELIPVLQSYFYKQTILPQDDVLFNHIMALINILSSLKRNKSSSSSNAFAMHVTLQNILALIACKVQSLSSDVIAEKRPSIIVQNFRTLLHQSYKQEKKPSYYANALHISVKHLNDTVKAGTGLSVSLHIQQEIILEARRLLYHSNLSVKEIAYDLGYDDSVYFTRLFKKTVGLSPLVFKKQFSH